MSQIVKVAWASLCKKGEELCGDWVKVARTPTSLSVVLSDGLGSGVKANILSTLTVEIASTMFEGGASVDEVIETLAATLPECQQRHLAYATFAVLQVQNGRDASLVEYDSEPLIWIHKGELMALPGQERQVAGRTIRESRFQLDEGDYMVMVSDGYVHAGVGGLYRFGWGWNNVAQAVRRWADTRGDAHQLVGSLRRTCLKLYDGAPGDDATAVAMRVRQPRSLTVLTGPPSRPELDGEVVDRFMAAQGARAICGGTTAQMAARVLGRKLAVEWEPPSRRGRGGAGGKLPPVARLEGVDLVTEGILTLSSTSDLLRDHETIHDLPPGQDAATRLAGLLFQADEICFMVGDAINPHQVADVVRGKPMRQIYVEELVEHLIKCDKRVVVEHY